jgi:hypothetical protein
MNEEINLSFQLWHLPIMNTNKIRDSNSKTGARYPHGQGSPSTIKNDGLERP